VLKLLGVGLGMGQSFRPHALRVLGASSSHVWSGDRGRAVSHFPGSAEEKGGAIGASMVVDFIEQDGYCASRSVALDRLYRGGR